ncbi:MAG TPA: hypothetical protein VNJ12_13200 [Candidatus Dormibacteraeota bacterium]|nr:hypothetical protein [Candidatus Dormibacteraeota bacterium]
MSYLLPVAAEIRNRKLGAVAPPIQAPAVLPLPPAPVQTVSTYPGTPVPIGTSTNSSYVASDGTTWLWNADAGTWLQAGTFYPGTPVPTSTPTNQVYTAADGSQWVWNQSTAAWINVSSETGATSGGTPVPANYPKTQIYTDSSGNEWIYSTSMNNWVTVGAAGAGSTAAAPATTASQNITDWSGYQSVLNWLTETNLVSPVPNWIVALGAGVIFYKLIGRKR